MTGSEPFTWRDYSASGFTGLDELLGPEFRLVPGATPHTVEIWHGERRLGDLLAIDPAEILDCLGPSECSHIDPDTYDESCLSLSLAAELFPNDSAPQNLAAAASAILRCVS
jgi:hypothetical protein